MAFQKGNNANPGGRPKEKPFAEALRMELASAGDDHKALRRIAKKLIDKAEDGDMQAIQQIADRLDGKPAQESTVVIDDKREATDWTIAELDAILNDARSGGVGDEAQDPGSKRSDRVH